MHSEIDPPQTTRLALPLSSPFITYILLAAIVIVWGITAFLSQSFRPLNAVLVVFGANFGPAILAGQTWRLFTSMFLHGGIEHLGLNAYALFIFGIEMERIFGPDRYLVIYILTGLFGSLASFAWSGERTFSVGASGAIFGIVGMSLAYFYLHRESFGELGRSRLNGILVIIGINLVFGLTVPRIDNMAHMGGLVAGIVLGYALAPRYQVAGQFTTEPRLVDTTSLLNRWWVPTLAIFVLASVVYFTINFYQ